MQFLFAIIAAIIVCIVVFAVVSSVVVTAVLFLTDMLFGQSDTFLGFGWTLGAILAVVAMGVIVKSLK